MQLVAPVACRQTSAAVTCVANTGTLSTPPTNDCGAPGPLPIARPCVPAVDNGVVSAGAPVSARPPGNTTRVPRTNADSSRVHPPAPTSAGPPPGTPPAPPAT